MNFVKKNYKLIVIIMIGATLISGISVYATGQYLASQVDYNNNGQAKVSDALDDLYNKVTELNILKSNINQANATETDILIGKKAYTKDGLITGTMESISSNYIEGTIKGEYNSTLIANCGFRPSKVYAVITWGNTSNDKAWASLSYNNEVFPSKYGVGWALNDSGGVLNSLGGGDQRFNITDTGFTYYVHTGYETLYWIAFK